MTDYLSINRDNWNARVDIHVASDFYDVEGFMKGRNALRAFEIEEVGEVAGRSLVHLQCHFGLDTLSWARLGAQVTGLDFSEPAIEHARRIAAECGIPARFVTADVYDAPEALGTTYDIVYTGTGALVWLPDVGRWAETVAKLLKPGGFLYLAEFHPITEVFDDETGTAVTYDYFDKGPHIWSDPHTYTGGVHESPTSVQFRHGLGEIVTALANAGLRLEFLHEHEYTLFRRYHALTERDGAYRTPEGKPRVPLMFSLRACAPPAAGR
ncbi:class I SAM-dependent methyltransferase [Nonomuraea sp. NPDC049309]|uniref:class I SAM-dependent methyltransferase n=1 Tax=Nonomuraea sp. NPDC049309 TaxID=3364350 RepID=UPI003724BEB1